MGQHPLSPDGRSRPALLDIRQIYHEPNVSDLPRGRAILNRFPDAERIVVPSHWNIPQLHRNEALAEEWNRVKRTVLVLGTKKGLRCVPYERSADFVAPSAANGCAMACAYCVVMGTLIATPRGQVPVEQIRDGDEVFAYDGSSGLLVVAVVAGTASREVDEVLEIQVGRRVLRVTAEHPIMTRRGWVRAGDLTEDDEVLCSDDHSLSQFEKIISIGRVIAHTTVHNFHVPQHESYVANGIVTHNCYVARRKGYANPITTFVNSEEIMATIARHAGRQGPKTAPTAADPALWVYELGTNSDGGVDATISDNLRDLIALFRTLPHAKATFSTKYVNRGLLDYDPQRKTRLRVSLMPAATARAVDVRAAPIAARIAAINEYYAAGYEVNVNFAPVIWYEGWLDDYAELFDQLDQVLAPEVKAQLAAEVVFLTHNEELHEVNERWHPHAEEWLWHPEVQEEKISGGGGRNVRYRLDLKRALVAEFRALLARKLPYCRVRYAF